MPQSYLHNTAFLAIWIVVKLDRHNDETHKDQSHVQRSQLSPQFYVWPRV